MGNIEAETIEKFGDDSSGLSLMAATTFASNNCKYSPYIKPL